MQLGLKQQPNDQAAAQADASHASRCPHMMHGVQHAAPGFEPELDADVNCWLAQLCTLDMIMLLPR